MSYQGLKQHLRYRRDGAPMNHENNASYDAILHRSRTKRNRDHSYNQQMRYPHNHRSQTSYSYYQDDHRYDKRANTRTSYISDSDSDGPYSYYERDERDEHDGVSPERALQKNREFKALCTEIAHCVVEAYTRSAVSNRSICDHASSILSPSIEDCAEDKIASSLKPSSNTYRCQKHSSFSKESKQTRSHDKLQPLNDMLPMTHSMYLHNRDKDNSHYKGNSISHSGAGSSLAGSKRISAQLESSPLRTRHSAARSPNLPFVGDESMNSPRELHNQAAQRPISDRPSNGLKSYYAVDDNVMAEGPALKQHMNSTHVHKLQQYLTGVSGQDHQIGSFAGNNNTDSSSDSSEDSNAHNIISSMDSSHSSIYCNESRESAIDSLHTAILTNTDAIPHITKPGDRKIQRRQPLLEAQISSSHLPSEDALKVTTIKGDVFRDSLKHDRQAKSISRLISSLAESSLYTGLQAVNFNKQAIAIKLIELSTDFLHFRAKATKDITELKTTVSSLATQVKMLECTLNGLQIGVNAQPTFVRGSGIFWNDPAGHKEVSTVVPGSSVVPGLSNVMQGPYPKIISTPVIENSCHSQSSIQPPTRSPEQTDVTKSEEKPPIGPQAHVGTGDPIVRNDPRVSLHQNDGYSESVHDSASSQMEANSLSMVQVKGDQNLGTESTHSGRDKKHRHRTGRESSNDVVTVPPLVINSGSSTKKNVFDGTTISSARKHTRSSIQDFLTDSSSVREKSPNKRLPLYQNSLVSCGDELEVQGGDSGHTGLGSGDAPTSAISTDDPERLGEAKPNSRRSNRIGLVELSDKGETQDQTSHTSAYHEMSDTQRPVEAKLRSRKQKRGKNQGASSKEGQGQGADETSYSHSVMSEKINTMEIGNSSQPELNMALNFCEIPAHPYLTLHPEISIRINQLDKSRYGLLEKLFISDLSYNPSIFNSETNFMIIETKRVITSIYILPSLQNNILATWPMACKTLGNLILNTQGPFWKATYQCARYLLALYTAYGSIVLDSGLGEIYQRFCLALQTMTSLDNQEILSDCLLVALMLDLICSIAELRQTGNLLRVVSAFMKLGANLPRLGLSAQVFPLSACLSIIMEELVVEESFQSLNNWITLEQEPQSDDERQTFEFSTGFSTNFYSVMSYITNFYNAILEHRASPKEPLKLEDSVSAGMLCNLISQYYAATLLQKHLAYPEGLQEVQQLQEGLEKMTQLVPEIRQFLSDES